MCVYVYVCVEEDCVCVCVCMNVYITSIVYASVCLCLRCVCVVHPYISRQKLPHYNSMSNSEQVRKGGVGILAQKGAVFVLTTLTMGWLRLVGSLELYFSFAEYSLLYRALLQKRPVILRSLLIEATL